LNPELDDELIEDEAPAPDPKLDDELLDDELAEDGPPTQDPNQLSLPAEVPTDRRDRLM
jgi:hypothetical protein